VSQLPTWLGSAIAFVYGTVVGSFLNVCIYRMPEEQSIIAPPSHCPKCSTNLKALDLVPLLSFLLLGRKCRYCGAPISWRYFCVELATGLLFVALYLRYNYTIDFYAYALFLSALVIAFMVDVDHWIIPDQVPAACVVIGLLRDIAHLVAGDLVLFSLPMPLTDIRLPMLPCVIGFLICGALFYLIAWVSGVFFPWFFERTGRKEEAERVREEGAMGGGDVKLAAGIGAVLGAVPALVSFVIAVFAGAFIGVALLVLRARAEKKGIPWGTEIPFGPYMVLGAAAVVLVWPQLEILWRMWISAITPA
jgi:leader peptidase (prepilin peptidase)/N-methyltransferase